MILLATVRLLGYYCTDLCNIMEVKPVSLTKRAAEEVQHTLETKNIPEGYALRVGIKGGGCGTMGYLIGFDEKQEDDLDYQYLGVRVLVAKKDTMYLIGTEVDFYEGSETRGFVFNKLTN